MAPTKYTCAHCDSVVGSAYGLTSDDGSKVAICPHCDKPTYFSSNRVFQSPRASGGRPVPHLPDDVAAAYDEARRCIAISAHTSAVLMCRKILMYVAVEQGDEEGRRFEQYVDYLMAKGYLPPNGRDWVDQIRKTGNFGTHKLRSISPADSEQMLMFTEMLLRFVFEMPAVLKSGSS